MPFLNKSIGILEAINNFDIEHGELYIYGVFKLGIISWRELKSSYMGNYWPTIFFNICLLTGTLSSRLIFFFFQISFLISVWI